MSESVSVSVSESNRNNRVINPNKIFVVGVDGWMEKEIKDFFSSYGRITRCKLVKSKNNKKRDYAFISFDDSKNVDEIKSDFNRLVNDHGIYVRDAFDDPEYVKSSPMEVSFSGLQEFYEAGDCLKEQKREFEVVNVKSGWHRFVNEQLFDDSFLLILDTKGYIVNDVDEKYFHVSFPCYPDLLCRKEMCITCY